MYKILNKLFGYTKPDYVKINRFTDDPEDPNWKTYRIHTDSKGEPYVKIYFTHFGEKYHNMPLNPGWNYKWLTCSPDKYLK